MRRMLILLLIGAVFVFSSGFVLGMFLMKDNAPVVEEPPPNFKEQKLEPVKKEYEKGVASRHEWPEAVRTLINNTRSYPLEVRYIMVRNIAISSEDAVKYVAYIKDAIESFRKDPRFNTKVARRVTPKLVLSLIGVESAFRSGKVGGSGEIGLCQIIPRFHRAALVVSGIINCNESTISQLQDPEKNIKSGVFILMSNAVHSKSIKEALAKYNAGNNVRAGMSYAHKVLRQYSRLAAESNI